MNICEFE